MTDPTIPDSQFDTDHPDYTPYPSMRQGEDGSLTLTYSGGELVSLDQGNTWRAVWLVDLDCGCPDDGSGLWIDLAGDADPGEQGGWHYADCDDSTPVAHEQVSGRRPTPTSSHLIFHVADGADFRDVVIADSVGRPLGRVMQTGPEWPVGWILSVVYPGYRIGPHGAARLPDTERGRQAAWKLEGR